MENNKIEEKQQSIILYAITNFGTALLFSFPATFLFHFFTGSISEGGLGFSIGQDSLRYLLIALGLVIGLLASPLFGYLSDRTRTRFGKRRIWMIIFCPLMAFSFVMLVMPFGREHFMSFETATIYLIIVYSIYSLFVNAAITPYQGLMAQITTPENRLKMSGVYNLMAGVGTAMGLVIPWVVHDLTKSWVMVCLVYSLIFLVTSLITIFAIKEPSSSNLNPSEVKPKIPYREILKNRKFLIFESAQFCWNLAFNLVLAALPAIAAAVFGLAEPSEFGMLACVLLVILGFFFFIYIRKGDQWGKQKVMTFALLYLALIFPLGTFLAYTRTSTVFPILFQGIIFVSVIAVGLAAFFVFPYGILLDIIRKDQEASYMGTNNIFMNASGAVGTMIIFIITAIYAEDAFFIVCPILGFVLLISGAIFLLVPLEDKKNIILDSKS
jgi:Na+/melibiose symporter-like transporter